MKAVTQSVGSTNVDKRVGEDPLVEGKNRNEVSCEEIESNNLAPMIGDACWSKRFNNRFICVGVDISVYALLPGERILYSPVLSRVLYTTFGSSRCYWSV